MPISPTTPVLRDIETAIRTMAGAQTLHVADVLAAILQGTGITIDRSTPNQIVLNATGGSMPPSFAPTSLPGAAITFADLDWHSASTGAVPDTATWLWVTTDHDDIGALPPILAANWRLVAAATVGSERTPNEAVALMTTGVFAGYLERLWLGRTVGNVPLLQWDAGRAGIPAGNFAVHYI